MDSQPELLNDPVQQGVAQIGDTLYASFDEALNDSEAGDTITLLQDVTTAGINLNHDVIIDGNNHTLSFTQYGIALWSSNLTINNTIVSMNGITSTPYTAEWNWMSICASKDASMTLNNSSLYMNGQNNNVHAIYFCSNNKLNLNNSYLEIINYQQDALEWDGGDGGYNVNMVNSTYLSDNNRSGFTGTFYASINHSTVNVVNSRGNGSNGSNFDIRNNSFVNFTVNAAHGLSASNLSIVNSHVVARENGANGIHVSNNLLIDGGSQVEITGNRCSLSSKWTIPGALYINGPSTIQNCTLNITDNLGSGIYQKSGTLTIADSASVNIIRNTATMLGLGGGININGTASISSNVQLYNNHASVAGDDIYSTGKVSFGTTGTNWMLDGDPDCSHKITGWFEDGIKGNDGTSYRWKAHKTEGENYYVVNMPSGEYEGQLALKAAHGLHTITIHYLEKDTNKVVHDDFVLNDVESGPYDVTKQGKLAIKGYAYVDMDYAFVGSLDQDIEINVYYTKDKPKTTKKETKKDVPTAFGFDVNLWTSLMGVSSLGIITSVKLSRKNKRK
ncbi:MAG: hypothetical protein PUH10_05410 [Erysipelotrichaceae bacterium]|uniref:hypothetical protein n=1 Tax=Floccifex sp. TaxID=2815810 RepID=UPI002A75A71C|nr:hypothetical protein [Floccifex sp.]MDD7281411.1 hypothetical protein [Erysipelotrichaceae bacterium]MDY2959113.1 hypothetical protein [Floccifex sp.]